MSPLSGLTYEDVIRGAKKEDLNIPIRELGSEMTKTTDKALTEELGIILIQRPDMKRFCRERLVLCVSSPQVTYTKHNDSVLYELRQKYKLVYNSPSLWTRLKFFIFDIVLWLKELGLRKVLNLR